MTDAGELLRPGRMKILLAVTLFLPVCLLVYFLGSIAVETPGILATGILGIPVSYAAGCVIDASVQSRPIKIAIASIAALVSILLGYIFTQTMTMVCDPVHDPGGVVCDPVHIPPTTPAVIATTGPYTTTPMIFDPVHEPGSCSQACHDTFSSSSQTNELVSRKLEECLRNCGR